MSRKKKLKKLDLRKFVSKTAKRGSIPGTVEYIGQPRVGDIKVDVLEFDELMFKESLSIPIAELKDYLNHPGVKWIQVTGVHHPETLNEIGKVLNLISLDLEDIANTTQRPRIEERDDYIFFIFKVLQLDP